VITAVTGTPGSGKSFRAVHSIVKALLRGKFVITNVALREGWEYRLARSGLKGFAWRHMGRWGKARLEVRAAELRGRVFYADSLVQLERVRVPCHKCGRRPGTEKQETADPERFCTHRRKEGVALAVVDEAYKWLNNRAYSSADRSTHVEWFKLHRKLGIDVELIEQHYDAIDKQVRDLIEFVIRLRNLKNVRLAGVRFVPFNLFLAIHVWNQGPAAKRHVAKRELYSLDWTRELYDTFATFHGVDALPEAEQIWLGSAQAGELGTVRHQSSEGQLAQAA
jgi:KaiC/GvpD/RAD55 family RecA-like ATPase